MTSIFILLGRAGHGLIVLTGLCAITAAADTGANATVSTTLAPDGGHIVVEAKGVPPPAPLFFSATADAGVNLGLQEITGEIHLKLHVLQGRPEVLTIGLSGDGDVTDVSGAGLRDWSVR